MRAHLAWGLIVLALFTLTGCQTPDRAAVQPLPPDAPVPPYGELVGRAKSQLAAAHEFFYRDSWRDVEQAADALFQTATFLEKVKTEDVPAKKRDQLTKLSKDLAEGAHALRDAGHAQDPVKTTEAFQRLHLTVRDLRAE
jgi:hypothetical protein